MNWIALASAAATFSAAFLAYHDKPGWGWFLFAAVLMAGAASDWKPYATKDDAA